jgi:ATP-dependent DNA helicase RecG
MPQEKQRSLFDERLTANPRPNSLLSPDDIFTAASERLFRELAEDERIERKSPEIHCDELCNYFSMWANTAPHGGIIVVGMENKGAFSGCSSLSPDRLNDLQKTGHTHCPGAKYDVKRVEVRNTSGATDFVLVFRVYYHRSVAVETHRGSAFARRGDSCIRLSDHEKRELAIDKGQVEFEQESCGLAFPDEFDMAAIRQFCLQVRKLKSVSEQIGDLQILENRMLGRIQSAVFMPNIACALLFAKRPQAVIPGCMLRFQKFEGTAIKSGATRNVVRDVFIEGRVPDVIVDAATAIESQVRTFSTLGPDGKFYTAPEYPREAWYEAVVNACVHRSALSDNSPNLSRLTRRFRRRNQRGWAGGPECLEFRPKMNRRLS